LFIGWWISDLLWKLLMKKYHQVLPSRNENLMGQKFFVLLGDVRFVVEVVTTLRLTQLKKYQQVLPSRNDNLTVQKLFVLLGVSDLEKLLVPASTGVEK
jgi:hypothetical protein